VWPEGASHRFQLMMPIGPDGKFAVDGAPTSAARIGIATRDGFDTGSFDTVAEPAGTAAVHDIALKLSSADHTIDVITRSQTTTAFDVAQVLLVPGHHAIKSV